MRKTVVRPLMAGLYQAMQRFQAESPRRLSEDEREGKATALLTRRNLTRFPEKRAYVERVVELIRRLDLTVFAMVAERPAVAPYEGPDCLQTPWQWLRERIHLLVQERAPGSHAVVVFDGRNPVQNVRLDSSFSGFLFRSQAGRRMTRIVPNLLFVDSQLTPGVRLADFCAYVLRVYYENGLDAAPAPGDPYLADIARYAGVIREKSLNFPADRGRRLHGIRTMSAGHFRYVSPGRRAEAASAT
jgi:hypothetical protein